MSSRSECLIKLCRDYGHNAGLLSETFKSIQFAEPASKRAQEFDYIGTGCWIVSLVEKHSSQICFETVIFTTENKLDAEAMLKAIDAPLAI